MKTKTPAAAFKFDSGVPAQRIADTLVSAFEGGSNYWVRNDNIDGHPSYKASTCDDLVAGKVVLNLLDIEDNKHYSLGREQIERGVKVMAEKYPRHFGDMVGENDDAETGDVLLQCCVFGEVVYG